MYKSEKSPFISNFLPPLFSAGWTEIDYLLDARQTNNDVYIETTLETCRIGYNCIVLILLVIRGDIRTIANLSSSD